VFSINWVVFVGFRRFSQVFVGFRRFSPDFRRFSRKPRFSHFWYTVVYSVFCVNLSPNVYKHSIQTINTWFTTWNNTKVNRSFFVDIWLLIIVFKDEIWDKGFHKIKIDGSLTGQYRILHILNTTGLSFDNTTPY